MDFSDGFRIVNLVVAVCMLLGGVASFFHLDLHGIIIGLYLLLFGLATGLLEFQIPPQLARYASFLFSFVGRGAFYIFVGSLLLNEHWVFVVTGAVVVLVGIAYVVLEFVPSIEPPANMREADGGWGAEQV